MLTQLKLNIRKMYPTLEQIKNADHKQICKWYRFLASPKNAAETNAMNAICEKFKSGGGMTPEISKQIGW